MKQHKLRLAGKAVYCSVLVTRDFLKECVQVCVGIELASVCESVTAACAQAFIVTLG